MGGESPVNIEGIGFNKNRLQSLYLYHQFKGNKLITSKFLRKSDYMHVRRLKKLNEILPRIPGALDSSHFTGNFLMDSTDNDMFDRHILAIGSDEFRIEDTVDGAEFKRKRSNEHEFPDGSDWVSLSLVQLQRACDE